jgi:internalin A
MPEQTRDQVFISYSHHDQQWQEKLRDRLSPMVRNGSIKVWADTALRGGDKWKEEIDKALRSTKVAVRQTFLIQTSSRPTNSLKY